MLRPDFAFCHRALWEKRLDAGVNRADYAGAVEVRCRVNLKRDIGKTTGSIFLPAGLDAAPGDRLTFGGRTYFLTAVTSCQDFSGRENHIEGEMA